MIHNFFDRTLKRHGITGKKLSEVTGISQTHISEFRHGKTNPSCETLMLLLEKADQIEPGAKQYFCQLLAGRSVSPLAMAINTMSSEELAQLLLAIAEQWQIFCRRSPNESPKTASD